MKGSVVESLFVKRDPRRGGFADISYLVDQSDGSALGFAPTGPLSVVVLPKATTEADNKDRLKYAPRAIMNAVHISPFTTVTDTDNASFCSIWASRR